MAVFFPEKAVFLTHFMDLQDLRILRGPKMENRSPPGPKLCYLFQAGIPKIGLKGQINGVLTPKGGQNSLPKGKSVLGTTNLAKIGQIWGPWSRIWASQTLDRGSPTPNLASQRPNFESKLAHSRPFWPPGDPHFGLSEVKMTPNLSSGRSKIDHFTQFSSFL